MQGEGPHVGAATLFVRLGGCDLRCRWCDSPHTWRPAERCRVGSAATLPNPVSIEQALRAADDLGLAAHAFACLTGGEPLLQAGASLALARALRERGPRVLLETHGLAADALERVVEAVDVVSMDWKLSSDVRRAGDPPGGPVEPFHEAHEQFLRVATRAPERNVKVVVTSATTDAELDELCTRIARSDPGALLVLQPVTPFGDVTERPTAERLLSLRRRAADHLRDVRIIPQTHPIYGAP
ncbi:MAG: 7-carboxy-7-deazaguanine synthase QueE [Myxococcota bacterium]|nr:7-carboxy-7-deazaguanine synthase QueE [Myxococcota bacterium]